MKNLMRYVVTVIILLSLYVGFSSQQVIRYNRLINGTISGTNTNNGTITGGTYTNATVNSGTIGGTTSFSSSGGINTTGNLTVSGSGKITNNLGIGASALTSNIPVVLIGASTIIQGLTGANYSLFNNNVYSNGSNDIYITNGTAARLYHDNTGQLIFENSISGTAGAIVAMVNKFSVSVNGVVSGKHFKGGTSTPTPSSGSGLGTGFSGMTVTGNDSMGKIAFTTGTGPTNGTIIRVTFNQAFTNAPPVLVEGTNDGAKVNNTLWVLGTVTTTYFELKNTASNTLPASTAFTFVYKTEEI